MKRTTECQVSWVSPSVHGLARGRRQEGTAESGEEKGPFESAQH